MYILFLAVWNASLFVFLSFITNLDLFPLLVLFVCSYSKGINKTFKRICHWILWNVGAQLNFAAGNGFKNERHQSEQGVQQENVQTALCPQSMMVIINKIGFLVLAWRDLEFRPIFSVQTSHQFNTDQKVSGFANRVNFFS